MRRRSSGDATFTAGALWSCVNAASSIALPFLAFVIFARHLDAAALGAVVLANAMAEVVKALGMPGLYEALLTQSADTRAREETAAAVLWILGLALFVCYGALIVILHAAGDLAAMPAWPLGLLGLRIPLDLAAMQPQAALVRRMALHRLALRAGVANLGALLIALPLVLRGEAVAGLIVYLLLQSLLGFLASVVRARSLARPRFDRAALVALTPQASPASVTRLVAAANNSLDQVILGAALGGASLAHFNIGKRIETAFVTAASAFSAVLFQPLFASRPPSQRAAVLARSLALATLVFGVPCALFVPNVQWVVTVVFGRAWASAAPTAAFLAIAGLARALGAVHGALLSTSGRNHALMTASLCSAGAGILLVLALAPFGSVAVAAALAAKNVAVTACLAGLTRTDAPRLAVTYARRVALPLAAGIICGIALRHLAIGRA